MPGKYIAAIDQGTSSTRCLIFDHEARTVSSAQMEHRQIFPQPGWVEHDPLEIWANVESVVKAALERANIEGPALASIGLTNQRETTLIWSRKTGRPLCNAIVWQCTRSQAICDELARQSGQDRFKPQTGLPLSAYFSGPKIKWALENIPDVREAAGKGDALFGNIDSWLIWQLTGGPSGGRHVTDVTNASRTMLMDLRTLRWDPDILKALGIPPEMLPEIRSSSDSRGYGFTQVQGPFGASIPICGDIGDQQSALVGQACFTRGEAKNTYGTGCFLLMNTGSEAVPSRSGLLTTVAYQIENSPAVYCLEGSIAVAGALVQWLRDNLGLFARSGEVEDLARSVPDNGGVYIVPAFSGLFAPHWRGDARGIIAGLTRFSNKAHFARAALEATAFQTRDVLDAMERESGARLAQLKVDGGMVRNELLMQFQADVLNTRVVRSAVGEATALGAAFMAGLASGYWKNLDELAAFWHAEKTWEGGLDDAGRNALYAKWNKAVQRSFGWID
jgi:glycerol kinase